VVDPCEELFELVLGVGLLGAVIHDAFVIIVDK
jgi:hypothetical protein